MSDLCRVCGLPVEVGQWPCITTARPHGVGTTSVIGDECDFVSHNGEATPVRFRSKQEHRRWLKQHGYRINDGHIGQQGSDKSPFSRSAVTISQKTLDDAKAMLERVSIERTSHGSTEPQRGPGITSFEGLTRYLTEHRHE